MIAFAAGSATLLFDAQVDGSKTVQCRRRDILPDPLSDPFERALPDMPSATSGSASLAANLGDLFAVDDREVQTEPPGHLVVPLVGERRGAYDHDTAGATAQKQLLDDHACLYRSPEPDIVGDKQVDARKAQRANSGLELIVLNRDTSAERCLKQGGLGAGYGSLAQRVEEGAERRRVVEPASGDVTQGRSLQDATTGLELPQDAKLLTEAVVLNAAEGDHRRALARVGSGDVERQCACLSVNDNPVAAADGRELADLGQVSCRLQSQGHRGHTRRRTCGDVIQ